MKYLTFKNGDQMPAIGLGTWKAKDETVKKAVKYAIASGYRHIDTAAIYGNEVAIGEAINESINEGLIDRYSLFITSKLWNNAHHPESVLPALKESLEKLKLDYLDLYLVHWPVAFKSKAVMPRDANDYIPLSELPIENSWRMMEQAKKEGLAKHIGVSNFSKKKLENLIQKAKQTPEVNQVELQPLLQQNELLQFCKQHHIHLTAYSPLGSRDRAQEMKAENEPNLFEIPIIKNIAEKHQVHPASVLINWHLQRNTSVIPKSTSFKNIEENLKAASLKLDEDDLNKISTLDKNYRFITGKFFEMPEKGYENIYDE